MAFTLPPLPYAYSALEPYIDTRTMEIHHDKHHQAYVDNLNKALEGHPELQDKNLSELLKNLEAIPEAIRTAVRNNGGGDSNHTLFWTMMKPQGGGEPQGRLGDEVNKKFGSFAAFQDEFNTAAKKRFGSGWAWLIVNRTGDLEVISSANQDTPVSDDQRPLLGLDVWEHAYYLKYQNRRPDYINAWWHVVNWETAYELFEKSGF
jgi:Fe-Mn family superoxide dismutase